MKIKPFDAWTGFDYGVSVYEISDDDLKNLRSWCTDTIGKTNCKYSSYQFYFRHNRDRTAFLLRINSIAQ